MEIIRKDKSKRIEIIDALRGLAVVYMVIYHFVYDAVSFLGILENVLNNAVFDFFQTFFACVFVVLAGVSSNFSKSNLKRGLFTFAVAMVISIVTFIIDMPIVFGILHLLGLCMIFYGLTGKLWKKIPQWILIAVFIILAILSDYAVRNLTVESENLWIFGFCGADFVSFDYFPLFPWLFVFMTGTAVGYYIRNNRFPRQFYTVKIPFLPFLGRYSLIIYLAHQPLLYGLVMLIRKII